MFVFYKFFYIQYEPLTSRNSVMHTIPDKCDEHDCFVTQLSQYQFRTQFFLSKFCKHFPTYNVDDVATRIKTQRLLLRTWLLPTVIAYTANHFECVHVCADVCVREKKMWKIKDNEKMRVFLHCHCFGAPYTLHVYNKVTPSAENRLYAFVVIEILWETNASEEQSVYTTILWEVATFMSMKGN